MKLDNKNRLKRKTNLFFCFAYYFKKLNVNKLSIKQGKNKISKNSKQTDNRKWLSNGG